MGVVILLAAGVIIGVVISQNLTPKYVDRGLPVLAISLNGVSFEEIKDGSKSTKYPDNELTVYTNNEATVYTGVELKGRGNLNWAEPKKPLQVKLAQSTNLLGLGKAKTWILLSNSLDASYLRSDAAFKIAEMVDENYAKRGQFVELYVGGEYQGLYYLLRKNVVSKNVINLKDELGVMVELDNLHWDGKSCYRTYGGNCLTVKDAVLDKDEEVISQAMTEFLTDFNQLEMAAEAGDYATITEMVDVESLAKYFLINELAVNPDAYSSSFYWYKDGVDDKLHAGPVWDFDLAFGNRNWIWARDEGFYSPLGTMVRRPEVFGEGGLAEDTGTAKLMYYLMEIPEFKTEVERLWQEKLQGREEELLIEVQRSADLVQEAAKADNELWGKSDYELEMESLIEWIRARYRYFEENYGNEVRSPQNVI